MKHSRSQNAATPGAEVAGTDRPGWGASFWSATHFLLPVKVGGGERLTGVSLWWFLPVGVAVGLCWVALFRVSWRVFGEVSGIRLMPALVVLVADLALFGRRFHAGAARTALVSARRPHGALEEKLTAGQQSTLAICLPALVLAKFVLLVSLTTGPDFWPSDWRRYLLWAYPHAIYRPLLLAPMWACWGVLLASGVGRSHPSADAGVSRLARESRPLTMVTTFLVLAAWTTIYCARRQNATLGAIISLAVFALTFLTAVVLSRRQGGHTRDSLLATGLAAQLAFLLMYVGFGQALTRW